MRPLFFFISLALTSFTMQTRAHASPPLRLLLDQSHAQIFSPYNPTFEGYTKWARLLVKRGVHVHLNTQPLTHILPQYGKGTVLVMGIATHHKGYTKATLDVIASFLQRGGGLLVMTEHDNLFEVSTRQNQLANLCHVRALPTGIMTKRKDTGNIVWIETSLPMWDIQKLYFYFVAPLVVFPPAQTLLLAPQPQDPLHSAMGAFVSKGKGRCVVLGDAEWNWDGVSNMGIQHAQNSKFAWRLFAWLAQTKQPSSQPTSSPTTLHTSSPTTIRSATIRTKPHRPSTNTRILAPTSRRDPARRVAFLDPQTGLSPKMALRSFAEALRRQGLSPYIAKLPKDLEDAELVIVPQPVTPLPKATLQALQKARRIVFLADGTSDFLRVYTKIDKLFQKLLHQLVVYPLPFDAITSLWGFHFAQGTVLSARLNSLEAPARWANGTTFLLRRATYIKLPPQAQQKGWQILARTAPKSWFAPTLMGVFRANGKHTDPFSPPSKDKQQGGLPIVAMTSRIFVVSDLEPFTEDGFQTPAGRSTWKAFLKWFKTPQAHVPNQPTSRPTSQASSKATSLRVPSL